MEDIQTNVLPLSMDANFFFERAVSSLDRNRYDKALKYFRKAVEYEPGNPVNHCNMAGILSEMGDYEASNAVLSAILRDIDPSMTECYFYMANNYANMEQFEAAEEALITYLEEDESGQFLAEAEEMMDLLQYELHRPTKLKSIKAREGMVEHDLARELLEEGKFIQAVKLLEGIVAEYPDFLAARNNLALGYYYLGLFPEALDTIHEVLEQDAGNLHGLCNLAVFLQREGNVEALDKLRELLRIVVPFHQEHLFKLATTMGILGEHEAAYMHFRRLLKDPEVNGDPTLYHYAAVAAYNTGRCSVAKALWRQLKKLDPDSGISSFYLNRMDDYELHGQYPPISYHYNLPFEEQLKYPEKWENGLPPDIRENPLIRSSFFWALRHGDHHTKLQVIQTLRLIADPEVEEALLAFLLIPEEDVYLKDMAVFVLRSLGVKGPVPIWKDGGTTMIDPSKIGANLPVWRSEWQAVIDLAVKRIGKVSDLQLQHDIETLWVDFLTRLYPDIPAMAHIEGWAAALDYLTAKMHRKSITYEEIAKRYGISASTASKYARRVDQVCNVKEKVNRTIPFVQ
ncbi:tetratricopeptide repeat protein [Paenibacillus lentus]|uniref:Tetratricopeptide repeat protein n=2 Tax=Paenibacillus lentus TaxID=1338368 RepID=A0A3Q8S7A4_9BACL|nr:tetratricopeptide repeat protein [Paenibacillus lentus]AZK48848.1 tetratricopeptide repeat protein [Paenibacillus lentus]